MANEFEQPVNAPTPVDLSVQDLHMVETAGGGDGHDG